MKNLKYSLLLSVSLFASIQICWAMIEEDTVYEGDTVYHKFENSSISYRKGRFKSSEDNSTLYTKPRNLKNSQGSQSQDSQPTEIIITNQDERIPVKKTTEWPYCIHGQLEIRYGKIGVGGGSGILVGPHHVLTAGHNVYNDKFGDKEEEKWANSISVSLGLNGDLAPFGKRKVVKAYTFRQWVKNKEKPYDMALLLLDKSIGRDIGWGGLLSLSELEIFGETITVTGYPGDKACTKMMTMSRNVSDINDIKTEEIYYKNIYTHRGQSGGGIWINKWGSPYVLGVHTLGGPKEIGNSGVRLSPDKFKKIVGWISQTYVLGNTPVVIDSSSLINSSYSSEDVFKLATKYDTGEGVQVDKSTAIILYELAANQGHAGALCKFGDFFRVGGFFYSGKAIPQNLEKAIQLYKRSAQKNYAEAEFKLGWMYENGQGIFQDQQEALKWYMLAAKKGHAGAFCKLGDLYYSGEIVKQNVDLSVKLYNLSAQKNYAEAQFKLGWIYENGQGVLQDQQVALKWYKLAEEQGNREAISRIQVLESDLSINISPKNITILRDMSDRIKLVSPPELERNTQYLIKNTNTKKRTLQTPTKKVNKRSKKYIQHMKSLENQPKITQYLIPILKVNAN